MVRRSDHTKLEIRTMVIAAGQKIIKEFGFDELSTRKIANEIGYSVGTLYHFFDNYDDIILHINAVTIDDLRQFIINNMDAQSEDFVQIKQLANLYIDFSKFDYNRWSAVFEYKLLNNVELPNWYKTKINSLFEFIQKPLLNIIKNDFLAQKHSKILWAGVHGICSLDISKKLYLCDTESPKSLTDLLITNYLSGLGVSFKVIHSSLLPRKTMN